MRKKRVLVTISFSFSIRYIVRTGLLEKMRLFCEPVILITWNQEDLIGELKHKGYEVHLLIPEQQTEQYLNIRRKIDYWFNHFRLKSPSQNIQKSFLSQYKKSVQNKISKLSEIITILKFYIPGYATFFFQKESAAIQQELGYKKACEWLLKMNLDAVFTVTPFHKQEDTLLRACKASGLKMVTSILSFDNITKRGWIPVQYDVYMVWNKYNKNELHRIYPFTKNKIIEVTGAAQFDFYWDKKYVLSLDNWKTKVGLQSIANKKIILYAGGPRALFPNEPQYLQHIDEAIETGLIKNNPIVLFRCHPVDNIERWKLAIGDSSNIYFDTSWSGNKNLVDANITDDDIAKLCSTLAYTDVHVNLCSTMTIDGSAFYKPQIGPAYDSVSPQFAHLLKRMYWQEHFMPVINVNGIALANSKEQLVEYINEALEKPQQMTKAAKRVVEEIISYADGKCSQRVVNVLEKAIA